jgi:hypothetical protein
LVPRRPCPRGQPQQRAHAVTPALRFCLGGMSSSALVTAFARRLEADGAQQLWLIEDCFYTTGVSLAASALAVTDGLEQESWGTDGARR